ncbi:MAG: oligoendopeptidase F [Chloroflexi bacterium]|nr:oligoendopeptidase F [Chloroflexota bacterium]
MLNGPGKSLPHWDMTVVYPGLDSPAFDQGFQSAVTSIDQLASFFDLHHISRQEVTALDAGTVQLFEEIIAAFNTLLQQMRTLSAYVSSFTATNSRNELAQAKRSELQQHTVRITQLDTRLTAWIGSLNVEGLRAASQVARDHTYLLQKIKIEATHQMPPGEEMLASELNLSGGMAWSSLYGRFTSQMLVTLELDGVAQQMPMSVVRNLAFSPSREVRRQAYEVELETWKGATVPIAAALNSIKGQVNTLSRHRGWSSPLEEALFENNIDQQTLDAMMTAARESFPDFRRYLRLKARALNLPVLAWYDLFAPVSSAEREWLYDTSAAFIIAQFGAYSPRLQHLAERAFNEAWIDAEPRSGKVDGGFCMWLQQDQSRILVNYQAAFGGLSTLAHELGHAYHNMNLARRTPLQRITPMTLAETASIFCQTVVRNSALESVGPQEKLSILENYLQDVCQMVVDISSRMMFEQNLFAGRQQRELSAEELCRLLLDAQHATYGDGLDAASYHPYMWAVKPHYYNAGYSFYNFPYMFGLLFGLGLYAGYEQNPAVFKEGYDELLAATGMYGAAELAARFGIDIKTPDFWRSSLDMIRKDIDRFETLVDQSQA